MHPFLDGFVRNTIILSAFLSWMIAQMAKILCHVAMKRNFDFSIVVRLGGMPSSHSATVAGLATAVGWHAGFGSPAFGISFTYAILTMLDATTVRRAAGKQAQLLNEMIDELFKDKTMSSRKMIEFLGHTRLEVGMGMIIGILVSLLVNAYALMNGFETFPFHPQIQ
jgi:acid phosphatase family membrane protein YuiD